MRTIILYITFFCTVVGIVKGQELRLSVAAGGVTSSEYYVYHSFYGPYAMRGQFVYGVNVSYPLFGKGFGLFVAANNKVAKVEGTTIPKLLFTTSNYVAGIVWRMPFKRFECEMLGGVGNQGDTYELTLKGNQMYTVNDKMTIYHGGFNLFFPFTDFLDIMFGARITKNGESKFTASFNFDKKDIEVPSTLYTGVAGLSIHIFGKEIE